MVLNPNRFLIDEKRPERPLLLPPPLLPMSLAGLMLKDEGGEGTAEGRFLICGGMSNRTWTCEMPETHSLYESMVPFYLKFSVWH